DGCRGKYFEGTKNEIPIEDGLLSTNGWTFIDDSNNFLFDQSDWNWVQPRANRNVQDFYFMAYGKDYKSLLSDFTKIAGKVPIPPRYAFGYWWSRYWNYSDNELRDLVRNFEKYQLPLDVLVIDMDWHKTKGLNRADEFGQTAGWTGYTWEKSLFPDPDKFLKWVKQKDLKVTLNLHPASGIPADEMQYADFAKAMDFDTIGHKSIPFEVADKRYMKNLFNLVLHPIEKQGIDFWWLDWQQWPTSKKLEGLSNTWWLNYCFFTDQERQGKQRPLLYHRWGGLGNHRYQIGFSGDAIIDWETLDYQPYFTTTASNVLYGYWSHDLGGHFFGNIPDDQKKMDPELYTRWMQFGALSPIFRTHSTKDPHIVKDIWNFPHEYSSIITEVVNERYALVPYIYTMARKTYDTGISLCRPMYYDYPEKQEAYSFKNEYMFGD
ncbi:MAG: glycoside hydrolase family 31 protein, partial [Bacteroidota bacterium]|nr:glycoside hydrolase family 31 protein [Bacteroidota bacterium]